MAPLICVLCGAALTVCAAGRRGNPWDQHKPAVISHDNQHHRTSDFNGDVLVNDFLLQTVDEMPEVTLNEDCMINDVPCIELSNGLISRKWAISPNFGCVEYNSYLQTPPIFGLRTLEKEATVGFNGKSYWVGGIQFQQPPENYTHVWLNESWIVSDNLYSDTSVQWQFVDYSVTDTLYTPYEWTPGQRGSPKSANWPPKGLRLTVRFSKPPNAQLDPKWSVINHRHSKSDPRMPHAPIDALDHVFVEVHYEMLQGLPVMTKSLSVVSQNPDYTRELVVTEMQPEYLCLYGSLLNSPELFSIKTDFAHNTGVSKFTDPYENANGQKVDSGASEPCISAQFNGDNWAVRLDPSLPGTKDGVLDSFRAMEYFNDAYSVGDHERSSAVYRRMWVTLSPAILENPIWTQFTNISTYESSRMADQCNETGFEMMTFSFDTDFNMYNNSQEYIDKIAAIIEYAQSRGLEVGGYALVDMSLYYDQYMRVYSDGSLAGSGECYATPWSDLVIDYCDNFIDVGLSMVITDGPYPGWSCAALNHSYHDNLNDSEFRQQLIQNYFYQYMKQRNVYSHSPDNYQWYGANKNKFPYGEYLYTMPRWQQMTEARQLMYDNTYQMPPTSGWMFLPMIPYHGGPPSSIWEPLNENVADYDYVLGMYFSYAVFPVIRGYELYDNDETRQVVTKWVSFFKHHREVLTSPDIIHVRRPDNIMADAILHCNAKPQNDNGNHDEQGLLVVFNPVMVEQSNYHNNSAMMSNVTLNVNLYYTGIRGKVQITPNDVDSQTYIADLDGFTLTMDLSLPPRNISFYVLKQG